ncbi:MAG: hypothetical protein QOI40_5372, partial [Alphaproteobacteria bacterium]|nr:hypothetical protein [Alphaproteobacteria bacterium]
MRLDTTRNSPGRLAARVALAISLALVPGAVSAQ